MTVEGERSIERRPVSRIALTAATALCFAALLAIGGASVAAADHLDDATEADVAAWPTADDGEIPAAEMSADSGQSAYPAAFWGDGIWGGDGGFWGSDDSGDEARENDSRDDRRWNDSAEHRDWNDSDDDHRWDDDAGDDDSSDDDSSDDDDSGDDDVGDENETNAPPEAVITAPDAAESGESVVLSAADSTDDGSVESYEWTLGDNSTAASENVTHTYEAAGNYTVTLTVADDEGATANATATIQVENSSEDDGFDEREVERRIHERINEIRESEGLEPLNHDEELRPIARGHSEDMAVDDYFSHTSPDGDSFVDRYDEAGYDCSLGGGENIAMSGVYGEPSEEEIATQFVDMWMNSDGHRQNILTERWNNEGIGVYYDSADGEVYATQNFC